MPDGKRCGYRWGRAIVPIIALVLSGVFLGIGIFAKTPNAIVAWFSLALGVMGASEGPFWSSAVELGRKRGGTAAAIMNHVLAAILEAIKLVSGTGDYLAHVSNLGQTCPPGQIVIG